jgi:hypothetical protein
MPRPTYHTSQLHFRGKEVRQTNLPSHETNSFYDGGLYNLFTRKYAPRNGIGTFRMGICAQIPLLVNNIICDAVVPFDVLQE